jgi:uridine kinase
MSDKGVHFDREADLKLKRECEREWVDRNGTIEDFIEAYGKNYI